MIQRLVFTLAFRSVLLAVVIAGIACVFIAPVGLVRGEQTMSGTLRAVSAGVTWSGRPHESTPDVFTLKVDIPDSYRAEHPDFAVLIRLEWDGIGNDFDLAVSRDGRTVQDSIQGQTEFEEVRLNQPENGIYHIFARATASETSASYTSRIRLVPSPPSPPRRVATYYADPDGPLGPEMFQFLPQPPVSGLPATHSSRLNIEIDAFDRTLIGAAEKSVIDRSGTRLKAFVGTSPGELYLGRCPKPCESRKFVPRRIFTGGSGMRMNHPYPTIAADRAGGLHVAFSDGHDVFLISSADGGATWKDAVIVDDPSAEDAESAIGPWVIAGDSGRVGLTWTAANGRVYYAFTPDAFSPMPRFSYVSLGAAASPETLTSAAIDPFGNANLLFGSSLTRQIAGDHLFFGPLVTVVGKLKTETGTKQVSFSVRQDISGSLHYIDEGSKLSLSSARFTSSRYQGNQIALAGTGRLNNGTPVTFAVVSSDLKSDKRDFSISMSNGYYASGLLEPASATQSEVKNVSGDITQIHVPAGTWAQP